MINLRFCAVLLPLLTMTIIGYGQNKRLSFEVGTAMNFRLPNFQSNIDDYTIDLNAVNDRYFALSYSQFNLTVGLTGSRTSFYRVKWAMDYCACNSSNILTKASTIGGQLTYSPNLGTKTILPYAGLAYDRITVDFTGSIGRGSPFPFPDSNPDVQFMSNMVDNAGHRVSMVVGTDIKIKPRIAFTIRGQYGKWVSNAPFIEYDIKYYSDDFAYEEIATESGDQIRVAIGFRFDIMSK